MLYNNTEIFNNYFKINNKIIASIKIENLIKIPLEIPHEQRLKINSTVSEIVCYQDIYFKKHNKFNFQGTINIHCCKEKNKNFLIDGQHRYFSIKELVEKHKYKNQLIIMEILIVDTLEELRNNYNIINKNTQLPKFPKDLDKAVTEKVCDYFFENYKDFWSISTRPTRPNLNYTHFQEAVGYLNKELNKQFNTELSYEQLKKFIIDINNDLSHKDLLKYENLIKLKTKDKIIEKCTKADFYLGIYTHKSVDYGYGWVNEILSVFKKTYKKNSIPPVIKNEVWTTYIGNKAEAFCTCCNKNKIKMTSFHCGHILAEINGGLIELNNLRPICKSCNSSMGTQNMKDYMKKYFIHNKL